MPTLNDLQHFQLWVSLLLGIALGFVGVHAVVSWLMDRTVARYFAAKRDTDERRRELNAVMGGRA